MHTQDPYVVKAVEYLACVAFLPAFALFWRFVNADAAPACRAPARSQAGEWFRIPERVHVHPGHAWARLDAPGVLSVGLDDFAQHLIGPLAGLALPRPGDALVAGAPAWRLQADSKAIDMLAPVTGTVVDVNESAINRPELVNADPYGRGWLLRLKVANAAAAIESLMSGQAARTWIDMVTEELVQAMTPELGHVCQDGGLPVKGLARAIDEAHWDDVARRFLLS
jgi:glycine cleavage system H protein